MGYPTEANFTRFGCSGISTIGTGGQGVFFAKAHGWSQSSDWVLLVCLSILRSFIRLCVSLLYRGKCLKVFVSSRCNHLEINKASLIEKTIYHCRHSYLLLGMCKQKQTDDTNSSRLHMGRGYSGSVHLKDHPYNWISKIHTKRLFMEPVCSITGEDDRTQSPKSSKRSRNFNI
jgi:hypothetical protein